MCASPAIASITACTAVPHALLPRALLRRVCPAAASQVVFRTRSAWRSVHRPRHDHCADRSGPDAGPRRRPSGSRARCEGRQASHRGVPWAGAYLFSVPMYNNSVPSAFNAWIDQVFVVGRVLFGSPDQVPTRGRRAVVVASRRGGYGPGSPAAAWTTSRTA
ncbi:NAD(P)H-dependent oxidoreductase [Streptomyces peucetius]|uniref:NAD(P)H-dependent oxidoreductase n=2 Tax=Streptomyces peucetius TaxID=1950 RepID=A0ABY6II50_STRPE|nr:NAD(P)H-dependent oxidoreductase [Streptomyces peucetius]